MKLRGCILLLALSLCVYTASAQKTEREKVYEVAEIILTKKSYEFFLQYVDVVNGVAINASGLESRMTDDAIKQRRIFIDPDLVVAIPSFDDCAIVVEKNMAMVNITSDIISATRKFEITGTFENFLLLRKLEGKWKMVRWMQIQRTVLKPQEKPDRREWR